MLGIRCSTRPDAVDTAGLARLASLGLDTVELGVQSFQDRVLERSGRGYDAQAALAACAAVKAAGLTLGIQCMPGLPGMTAADFLRDVEILCRVRPAVARLYPCLVLDGSALAGDFRQGAFRPWSLDRTLHCLTLALPRLWRASVRVIRMGLAPEAGLTGRVLAGPAHPALGQMARSRALLTVIRAQAAGMGRTPQGLRVPRPRMGELFGQRNELAPAYERLGLPRHAVQSWPLSLFCLY